MDIQTTIEIETLFSPHCRLQEELLVGLVPQHREQGQMI